MMGSASSGNTLSPNGNYALAKRHRDMVFTSGMTPRQTGVLIQTGTITSKDDLERFKGAVELAASNALAAARKLLARDEQIDEILSITVFVSATADFTQHSCVADYASDYFFRELGERGIGARAAIGAASLPGGSIVEIQITATVAKH